MSLQKIQERLKAPKSQYNSFGKYPYRNLEDILEALKPLLAEYGCFITISDSIVQVGTRYYVEATVRLMLDGSPPNLIVENRAYAREAETKKGMDESQITGAASSYARKYALNGLFAIDDTKDADSSKPEDKKQPDNKAPAQAPQKAAALTENEMADITTALNDCKSETDLNALYEGMKDKINSAGNKDAIIKMFGTRKAVVRGKNAPV